eukprot:CAMPEP_0182532430 /NCGR_PEP_ID=MMETSP1323-20130603/11641_1 /TAXON_ID=236787 /ORGANISM="Florenciella parvula, Strain RCC1693" /LENGTH=64 /DNA_ID=CAMNT_0024742175 /DNA_START=8 /DNA_END=202 /DNA_ORIENTATION=+
MSATTAPQLNVSPPTLRTSRRAHAHASAYMPAQQRSAPATRCARAAGGVGKVGGEGSRALAPRA